VTESTGVEVTEGLDATAGRATDAVAVLQAVADPVRWTVVTALAEAPRCVCDLQEQVPVAGNLLSYHLKVLRDLGLVTASRRGRWIDYALAADAPDRMRAALPGLDAASSAAGVAR
jgi:DNA-binding transcriptional ArsR family regulator